MNKVKRCSGTAKSVVKNAKRVESNLFKLTCAHLAPEGMCTKCVADTIAVAQEKGRRDRSCGATRYYLPNWEIQTHGCIEVTCKTCGSSYCQHWLTCPRCIMVEAVKTRKAIV